VTKRISVLLALVGCLVATPGLADDVLDALAILSDGLKCARDPAKRLMEEHLRLETTRFSGNRSVFQIQKQTIHVDGRIEKSTETAKFADLGDTSKDDDYEHSFASLLAPPRVHWTCVNHEPCSKSFCLNHNACIQVVSSTKKVENLTESSTGVCNMKVANHVVLAINTLIKWNKEHDDSRATGEAMPSAKPPTSSEAQKTSPFNGVPVLLGPTQKTSPFSGVPVLLGPR